jgi:hypothetical protein
MTGPRRSRALLLAALLCPGTLAAQAVRVALADTAAGAGLSNVLVALVPADGGASVDQGLTSATGVRLLRAPSPGRYAVVVRRVGFTPERFGPYTLAPGAPMEASLRLAGRRVQLAAVTLSEQTRCGPPAEGAEGGDPLLAVWDALRTALEASAQTRAEQGVPLEVRTFERGLTLAGKPTRDHRETPWTPVGAVRPFSAAVTGNAFVIGNLEAGADFFGPDERTFLGDAFVRGHCFTRVAGSGETAGLVGLRFEPTRGVRHADIAGVLWLDPATAELRHVAYRYVGIDYGRVRAPVAYVDDRRGAAPGAPVPGGRIEFTRLPSNAWIVSRWTLRMPRIRSDRGLALLVLGLTEVGAEARLVTAGAPEPAVASARGVVWDSLLARPLAGALVFGPGGRSTVTTGDGRWMLDSLPDGAATFTVAHAALDSLGLYDVGGAHTVGTDTAELRLATPSLATLRGELCPADGAVPSAGPGLVYGTVREASGAAPAGTRVEVAWTVLPDASALRRGDGPVTHGRATTADAQGVWVLCGVPTDEVLRVRAVAGPRRTGVVELSLPPTRPLAHLELVAPTGTARAVLRGQVRDSAGRPVVGAAVRLVDEEAAPSEPTRGAADAPARTGDDGGFRVGGLPEGTVTIEVSAIGYLPERRTLPLRADEPAAVAVLLRRGSALAATVVRARFTERFFSELDERRRTGAGTIRTHEELARYPQLSSALRDVVGVRVVHTSGNRWQVRFRRGPDPFGGCEPQIYLDGMHLNPERPGSQGSGDGGATDMLAGLAVGDIAAMEVYLSTSDAPQKYVNQPSMCGVLLVWTQWYARLPAR